MNKAQNLPTDFIYAVAAAEGIHYSRPFTYVHRDGTRRIKLWYLRDGFQPEMFKAFKATIEATFPEALVTYSPSVRWIGANIQVFI